MPARSSSAQQAEQVVEEVLHRLYDGLHSRVAAMALFSKMDLKSTGLEGRIENC